MSEIFPGRYTARTDEPLVVFLIGMRINRLRAIRTWLPVAREMQPMLETFARDPEKGYLGGTSWLGWRSVMLVQYWRSFEDLEAFARNPSDPHRDAWARFNRAVGADGTVGIWHETFLVPAGHHESLYGNMPRTGLAAATSHVPVTPDLAAARRRLRREREAEREAAPAGV
jgi:hypothetical protein